MNVLVTGASGFVGSALTPLLTHAGHQVIPLRRGRDGAPPPSAPHWNPAANEINLGSAAIDAVIHLAGETIAQRWTAPAKKRIRESRVNGTRLLSNALANLPRKPHSLLCASAVGIYGNRGDEVLTEASQPGSGFLAELCQEWEAAARPAVEAGIRVVHLRFGVLLDPGGGALNNMLPPFRAGVGGRLGSGRQFISWATRQDAVRAIAHALNAPDLSGPVNIVSPHSITNAEFTKTLARALGRPAILHMPAFALRLLAGEMADEALLASARVMPERLQQTGFHFEDAEIEPALRKLLAGA
jgi:uncharacterized protein (TIGR01777 family)